MKPEAFTRDWQERMGQTPLTAESVNAYVTQREIEIRLNWKANDKQFRDEFYRLGYEAAKFDKERADLQRRVSYWIGYAHGLSDPTQQQEEND